jgi:alkanesulfonate monooxygenase SsuD/methylene tetrahydromethanopterin reductase-like flavin-dependent oxidoreductase (luciferase family)
MQFGVFTIGDVTADPTTGRTVTERERIKTMVAIARKAEEVGLDVFATGEHHNPPFVPSSPTTMLGYVAAQSPRSTAGPTAACSSRSSTSSSPVPCGASRW